MEKGPQSDESYERENPWNRTISTVLWVHKKLPQSTVKLVLPSNESYESKTGWNRTLATVLWVPLNYYRRHGEGALLGPIGAFRAKPAFVKPRFGFPRSKRGLELFGDACMACFAFFLGSSQTQANSRVFRKHARPFMRTLAKHGEVWRTLANLQRHIQDKLPDIHQSSGEGRPGSPEFWWRCLLCEGGLRNQVHKPGCYFACSPDTLWHEIITKIIPWELFFVIFEAFCPLEMSRKERHFQGITREIRNFPKIIISN